MVLALQTGIALARFGAKPYVGSVVGLSLARELGPVLTALMVGGRVGAGITAEIGSMQVTEQVDAIRSMGADPVQKLVLPRVVAATLALPVLTVFANLLGVIGGLVISAAQFHISPNFYLETIFNAVTVDDVLSGLAKTFVFGWIIAMVACFSALQTTGGTVGVGRATTRTVVVASIAVLISDFFLTQLMLAAMTGSRARPPSSSCAASARPSAATGCCAASISRSAPARRSPFSGDRAAASPSASST